MAFPDAALESMECIEESSVLTGPVNQWRAPRMGLYHLQAQNTVVTIQAVSRKSLRVVCRVQAPNAVNPRAHQPCKITRLLLSLTLGKSFTELMLATVTLSPHQTSSVQILCCADFHLEFLNLISPRISPRNIFQNRIQ